jgi:hypothetical protein
VTARAPHELEPDFEPGRFHAQIYDRYRAWLGGTPVFRSSEGVVYLTRHADCSTLLGDDRFRRNSAAAGAELPFSDGGRPSPLGVMISNWMLFMDPPRHEAVRAVFARAFTAKALRRLEPEIRETAARLAAALPDAGEVEVVASFAAALPMLMIADILGLPRSEHAQFSEWTGRLMDSLDTGTPEKIRAGSEVAVASREYFAKLVRERRGRPADDLVGAAIAANEAQQLSDDELLCGCVGLVFAGHETTRSLIANGTLILAQRPALWRRLRERPELLDGAIEEMLRFESPVQKISRLSTEDWDFGGYRVPAGTFLTALLGAANRDPAAFDRPDEFDPERAPNRHLSFGRGRHACLGAILARMEARAAFTALLRRYAAVDFAGAAWREYTSLRSLGALRLAVRGA